MGELYGTFNERESLWVGFSSLFNSTLKRKHPRLVFFCDRRSNSLPRCMSGDNARRALNPLEISRYAKRLSDALIRER